MNLPLGNRLTTVELYLNKAQLLEKDNKIKEAIAIYQKAIEVYPHHFRFYYELGELSTKSQAFTEAIKYYKQAISLNPQWFKSYYALGQIAVKQNNLESAIDNYQKAINLKPDFSWSYFNLGKIYYKLNKLELAASFYQQAIEYHSFAKSYHLYLALGNVYLDQDKIDLAIDCYQQSLKINAQAIEAKIKLGMAYCRKSDWHQAIQSYNQVIKINPNCHLAWFGLGEIFRKQKLLDIAIANYRQALKIKTNDVKTFHKLQTCLAKKSPEKYPDYQAYKKAISEQVKDEQLYYRLGQKLSKQGLIEDAIECYLKVVELNPKCMDVYETIYNSSLYLDNCDRIINVYQKILLKNPNLLIVVRNLGKIFSRQGKIELAIKYNRQVAETQIKSKVLRRETAKSASTLSTSAYLTNHKNFPDPCFLIIGSEKCGTSSLYQYIIKHPNVLGAIEKEIHFFTYNFEKGLDWYGSHFPPFAKDSNYITGEASTSYIACHNNAPQRVFKLLPQVKLLAVIREPVERAISHYHQLVRLGKEHRSLEEAVQKELQILKNVDDIWSIKQKYWSESKGILWHSLYVYFLQQWLNVFPSEQLLIIKSQDLFTNPQNTMEQVFDFLELSKFKQQNYKTYNSGGQYNQSQEKIVKQMKNFFEPHNRKLEDLIDLNLPRGTRGIPF
ncbi:MAG: tetratricopeptide repeat protein [Xenococcaceae cyanobacterium MO_167.B27]|nr:tetratricopeptide repeat protein [Xenococcaceae cyanobacterium MO_167.B27]